MTNALRVRELNCNELLEVCGGIDREFIDTTRDWAIGGAVISGLTAGSKKGATIGSVLGPKGALGGAIAGAAAGSLVAAVSSVVNLFRS